MQRKASVVAAWTAVVATVASTITVPCPCGCSFVAPSSSGPNNNAVPRRFPLLLGRAFPASKRSTLPLLASCSVEQQEHQDEEAEEEEGSRIPLDGAVEELQRRLLETTNDATAGPRRRRCDTVTVEGYVTAKRKLGPSFCFLDIAQKDLDVPVQAKLKRQDYRFRHAEDDGDDGRPQNKDDAFDGIFRAMVPGVRVSITGRVSPTRNPQEALVEARQIRILGMPRNPQHVRIILQETASGRLDVKSIARATAMSIDELRRALTEAAPKTADEDKPYDSMAKSILANVPPEDDYPDDYLLSSNVKNRRYAQLPLAPAEIQHPPNSILADHHRNFGCFVAADAGGAPTSIRTINNGEQRESHTAVAAKLGAVSVIGWVQNRRRFRDGITAVELVEKYVAVSPQQQTALPPASYMKHWKERLKCVLHPATRAGGIVAAGMNRTSAASDTYAQLLAPGVKVALSGHVRLLNNSVVDAAPVLWVADIRLLRASWRPTYVRHLLELVVQSQIEEHEAAEALRLTQSEIDDILEMDDLVERQWRAAEISLQLQDIASRTAIVSPEQLAILAKFSDIRSQYPVESVAPTHNDDRTRQMSNEPLEGSRWRRKKQPQLEWMAQQVQDRVKEIRRAQPKRQLQILDVGGGKGLLANHLAELFRDDPITIHVIDIAARAIKNGAMRSMRRALSSVRYTVADASALDFGGEIDLVVALHACGALTDVALGHAAANGVAFVVCPCCFRSNPGLLARLPGQPTPVPVEQWLDVDAFEYDALKAIAEVQGDMNLASQAIHTICAIRASAVERHSNARVKVSIKTFPIAFSTRNHCLVGEIVGP